MAYLCQHQYEYRREAAASRNITNEAIAVEHGMRKEQAELISKLCSMRHEFHCNLDSIVKDGADSSEFERIEEDIQAASLPNVSIADQLNEVDDINGLIYEYGDDVPEDHASQEFQDWYDDEYARIYSELEDINRNIEAYLRDIDKQYGTSWCPTGKLRQF